MGLNIKNERTHRLVRTLAERTGQTQVAAVEDAVVRRLRELDATGEDEGRRLRRDAGRQVLRRLRRDLTGDDRLAMRRSEAELYDEAGLPR